VLDSTNKKIVNIINKIEKAMLIKDIQQRIESSLPNCTAIIEGEDGRHFTATVISPAFTGKSRIQKQQLVYAALGNHLNDGTIHAISIKTFTPEEYQVVSSRAAPSAG
jgi:acid stress-induced BolA-like protein IbaG/YrbA